MNSLNRFLGKPDYLDLENIGKVPILPLRPKDLVLFKENATPEEQLNANQEIFKRRCGTEELVDGKIVFTPFFTDEEIEIMPFSVFNKVLAKLMEVSGLTEQNDTIRKLRDAQAKTVSEKGNK
jgi:hypothetical protein